MIFIIYKCSKVSAYSHESGNKNVLHIIDTNVSTFLWTMLDESGECLYFAQAVQIDGKIQM